MATTGGGTAVSAKTVVVGGKGVGVGMGVGWLALAQPNMPKSMVKVKKSRNRMGQIVLANGRDAK
jgi:hypothetical protein